MQQFKSCNDLVEKLFEENKPVLIVDTCGILDIVRCVGRSAVSVFDAAQATMKDIGGKSLPFNIVLPSPFKQEWDDNITLVKDEQERMFKRLDEQNMIVKEIIEKLYIGRKISYFSVQSEGLSDKLEIISSLIIQAGYEFPIDLTLESRAAYRVRLAILPSTKGKDSFKDCIVFEEVLELAKLLRSKSFDKKIIFLSSNTKEYFDESTRMPKPTIKTELDSFNIDFTTKLDWGVHEVIK